MKYTDLEALISVHNFFFVLILSNSGLLLIFSEMIFHTITQCTTHDNLKFIISMHGCQVSVNHVYLDPSKDT